MFRRISGLTWRLPPTRAFPSIVDFYSRRMPVRARLLGTLEYYEAGADGFCFFGEGAATSALGSGFVRWKMGPCATPASSPTWASRPSVARSHRVTSSARLRRYYKLRQPCAHRRCDSSRG